MWLVQLAILVQQPVLRARLADGRWCIRVSRLVGLCIYVSVCDKRVQHRSHAGGRAGGGGPQEVLRKKAAHGERRNSFCLTFKRPQRPCLEQVPRGVRGE